MNSCIKRARRLFWLLPPSADSISLAITWQTLCQGWECPQRAHDLWEKQEITNSHNLESRAMTCSRNFLSLQILQRLQVPPLNGCETPSGDNQTLVRDRCWAVSCSLTIKALTSSLWFKFISERDHRLSHLDTGVLPNNQNH